MSKKDSDALGTRMKEYEAQTCALKLLPRIPIIARLDGRSFSSFTKGLKRPYDERLTILMIDTAKYLAKETNANVVYHQSDEISMVWYTDDIESQVIFNGKLFKMISTLAALATGYFNKHLPNSIPEKADLIPTFDCRVFNVPTLEEAVNVLLWRELDCTKNAISMAAQTVYSHKQLEKKNGSEKQEMLFQKGINFNNYPAWFKRGAYIQRKRKLTKYTPEELDALPAKHQAKNNPDLEIERWSIEVLNLPPLLKIENKIDVLIFRADAITKSQKEIV